jgi:hypothetical protein
MIEKALIIQTQTDVAISTNLCYVRFFIQTKWELKK